MPKATGDMESHVPHQDAVEALLYHVSGKTITVPEADAPFWLDQGFRRRPVDLDAAVEELRFLFPAALAAIVEYVVAVQADSTIDTGAGAAKVTAEYAMHRLGGLWARLASDIDHLYPVKQGAPVELRSEDGSLGIEVDPAQVDLYISRGWRMP